MAKAAAASKTSQPMSGSGTAPQYSYKSHYPPVASGPISYNDPCISMTTPPAPKNKSKSNVMILSGKMNTGSA